MIQFERNERNNSHTYKYYVRTHLVTLTKFQMICVGKWKKTKTEILGK